VHLLTKAWLDCGSAHFPRVFSIRSDPVMDALLFLHWEPIAVKLIDEDGKSLTCEEREKGPRIPTSSSDRHGRADK
jgi:hypothetical protein